MGLNARERRALHSIEAGLAASYPRLASRLTVFTRLTAGQSFPARENIRAQRLGRCLRWPLVWLLLWLVASAALISVGLAVGHGGGGACTAPTLIVCGVYGGVDRAGTASARRAVRRRADG